MLLIFARIRNIKVNTKGVMLFLPDVFKVTIRLCFDIWHCPRFCVNRKLEDSSRSFLFTQYYGKSLNPVSIYTKLWTVSIKMGLN